MHVEPLIPQNSPIPWAGVTMLKIDPVDDTEYWMETFILEGKTNNLQKYMLVFFINTFEVTLPQLS